MPRSITAYVSAFQRSRVWQGTQFYRTEKFTLTADFRAALPSGAVIEAATWQSLNYANVVLGAAYFYDTYTTVECTAGLEPGGPVKCEVTLDDGGKMTQQFVIGIRGGPWFCEDSVPTAGACHVEADGTNPSMTVSKTADVNTFGASGETITYTYVITNTGNVAITDLSAVDDKAGTVTLPQTTLAAGASMTAEAEYVTTVPDEGADLTNIVTVSGSTTLEDLTASDTLTIPYDADSVYPHFFYMGSNNTSTLYEFGYGYFDPAGPTYTSLATKMFSAWNAVARGIVQTGPTVFGLVSYDNVNGIGEQVSGLYAFEYDGTTTLAVMDSWQISSAQFHEYLSLYKMSDGTLVMLVKNDTASAYMLKRVSYDGTFTELSSLSFGDEEDTNICVHNDYVIVYRFTAGTGTLYAYEVNGSTFTLVSTYVPGVTLNASSIMTSDTLSDGVSEGTYIALERSQVFTFDGATFVNVYDGNVDTTDIQFDASSLYYRASSATLAAFLPPTCAQSGSTMTFAASHSGFIAMAVISGADLFAPYESVQSVVVIPSATGYAANQGGLYTYLSGDAFTRESNFTIPFTGFTPTGYAISHIQVLPP